MTTWLYDLDKNYDIHDSLLLDYTRFTRPLSWQLKLSQRWYVEAGSVVGEIGVSSLLIQALFSIFYKSVYFNNFVLFVDVHM